MTGNSLSALPLPGSSASRLGVRRRDGAGAHDRHEFEQIAQTLFHHVADDAQIHIVIPVNQDVPESHHHVLRTFHLTGPEPVLDGIAQAVLGVSLEDIAEAFRR
jgi:hypothetical protein